MPAAAGWLVGIIATLSLIASISPLVRWVIKVPREWVNDYIFNFPDTSFAWAFVLALLAAALAARKSVAWWILVLYMVAAIGWNVGDLSTGPESVMEDVGEVIGLVFHVAAIAFLVLARKEFWARVRRGALIKAAAALAAGMAVGILIGWGLLEMFPGSLDRDERLPYAANRVVVFAGVDADAFAGHHPHVFVNALLGLFGALALMVAAIVLFQSQRAENALTGEDESAIRGMLEVWGKNDSLGYFATRRDKSVVFAPNGRAAITYRVEVGVCLASGDPLGDPRSWPAAIGAWLTLCQSYGWAPGVMGASATAGTGVPGGRPQRPRTRRRGDSLPGQVQAVRARHEASAAGRHPGSAGGPHRAHPSPPRPVPRGDGQRHQAGRRLARHRDRAMRARAHSV